MSGADQIVDRGLALIEAGREDEALPLLRNAVALEPTAPAAWQALGLALRAAEQLGPAAEAFAQAALLAPNDVRIRHGAAQCRYEAGWSSVAQFEDALALRPGDPDLRQGLVAAIAAEAGPEPAISRLRQMLAQQPDWAGGYWLLSRLVTTAGRPADATAAIVAAVNARPGDLALWQQWLAIAVHGKDWPAARDIVGDARRRFPTAEDLRWSEAGVLSELGETGAADRLYQQFGPLPDLAQAVFLCRHWLRVGRPDQVALLATMLPGPEGHEALYPYFSLAWRLLADPKAAWLEPEALVGIYDLAPELPPLEQLADHLRSLHWQTHQPLEQSVRGGTQTDANLLLRAEPLIVALRAVLVAAVERHRSRLPPLDPAHPQLRHRRDRPIRFAGSWSVRLQGHGFHEEHVHPEGWFSSALYIALPDAMGGDTRAGWLTLGQPQQSLGLGLPPTRVVEPRPGRLVLFPSTMWHGTIPFSAGERLTCAFDVAVPR